MYLKMLLCLSTAKLFESYTFTWKKRAQKMLQLFAKLFIIILLTCSKCIRFDCSHDDQKKKHHQPNWYWLLMLASFVSLFVCYVLIKSNSLSFCFPFFNQLTNTCPVWVSLCLTFQNNLLLLYFLLSPLSSPLFVAIIFLSIPVNKVEQKKSISFQAAT